MAGRGTVSWTVPCSTSRGRGIQWIPGAGSKPFTQWLDLSRRILDGGKRRQVFATPAECLEIIAQLGDIRGVIFIASLDPCQREDAARLLAKYDLRASP